MATTVQCDLCPKRCTIGPGQSGDCRIRVNIDGRLVAVTYGHPTTVHVDPVEKKPLYHFLPGTPILSLATVGCNLHCKNCQNWEISQCNPEDSHAVRLPPLAVVALSKRQNCPSIAYTYTDPVVYYEYALDCARAAREQGLRSVLVTAGYINPEPLKELCRYVDAATVDVKAFSDEFYQEMCGATLKPILDGLVLAKSCGVWLEISNLVIPTMNDTDRDFLAMCTWVKENLGVDTPFHFLRFFPHYRLRNLPPTPAETLTRAREIAQAVGLRHVYVGNLLVPDSSTTACPACRRPVIRRQGHLLLENRLRDGHCPDCNQEIHGVWK